MKKSDIRGRIRAEFDAWVQQPKTKKDWELIWVLTGDNTEWGKSSDTRRRLEEAIALAKKVAKLSAGKIPSVYISGYDEHNSNLRTWQREGMFEKKYAFPNSKLLIGPQEHIRHTGDQFKLFPKKFLKHKRIVIVTDIYHIPRVGRYIDKHFPQEKDRFVFYPAKPVRVSAAEIDRETRKIIAYSKKRIIPLFPKKKIVVSGATGFLGSHFLQALKASDTGGIVVLPRDAFKKPHLLRTKLRGATAVFHIAGVNKSPRAKDYLFNVRSTKTLLEAVAGEAPQATFMFTSSFAVYRRPKKGETVTEAFPRAPSTVYGRSKLSAERAIALSAERDGTPAWIVRISNMYGPNLRPSDAIIDQIKVAFQKKRPIVLRTKPAASRDFVYIDDVVASLLVILAHPLPRGRVEVVNICSGEETTISLLLKMAEKATGKLLAVDERFNTKEVVPFWKGSFQKAKKRLQWQPKVKLADGLRKTLK